MKKVKEVYGFHVLDEVKRGNIVYYFDKTSSDKRQVCNEMTVAELANVIEEESSEFWKLDEQEVNTDA